MDMLKEALSDAWGSLHASFDLLWSKLSPILFPIVLIVIFLGVGLWVAGFISDKVGALIKKSKIDSLVDKVIHPISKLSGTKVSASGVISGTVKWFLIATVLIAALDLASLHSVIDFFNNTVKFLPNVLAAALIVIVGSMLGSLAAYIVDAVSKGEGNIANIAQAAVNTLAFIAALSLLVTPVMASFSQFTAGLNLSSLQADVFVIGVLLLILLASKNAITKTIEGLLKG